MNVIKAKAINTRKRVTELVETTCLFFSKTKKIVENFSSGKAQLVNDKVVFFHREQAIL